MGALHVPVAIGNVFSYNIKNKLNKKKELYYFINLGSEDDTQEVMIGTPMT